MPKFLKPWRMALPTIALVLLGLLWSGYWLWASSLAQHAVGKWRAGLAADGITVSCGEESWGGYPFRVELHCTPGKIASAERSAEFTQLTVMAQAYNLGHLLLLNDGETIITGPMGSLKIAHEGATASLIFNSTGQMQVDVEFTKPQADTFSAQRLAFHTRKKPGRAEQVLEIAAAMELGQIQTNAEPVAIDSLTLSGSLTPVPKLITYENLSRQGNLLTLDQIDLQSAAIRYQASGQLQIGRDAHLKGILKGRLQNLDQLLQDLADRGFLDPDARMGAGAVLGLLGGNSPEGMQIEIAADQGGLYIGPFRIADLPALF